MIELIVIILSIIFILFILYSIIPSIYYRFKLRHFKKERKDKKYICITFDDGPSKKYTPKLLDLLKKEDIKATFFVVAQFAKENPDIIKRMKEENHQIALHSLNHKNALFEKLFTTKHDFAKSFKIMSDLNVPADTYRAPWGLFNIASIYYAKKYNLKFVLWDVMAEDWRGNTTSDIIAKKLLKRTKNADIICIHDGRGKNEAPSRTIEALEKTIPIWKEEGYEFLRIQDV